MKKTPVDKKGRQTISQRKKRYNTIETDDDWEQKQFSRRNTFHRHTVHDQYTGSLDQSIQTNSTKNQNKKSIKFSFKRVEHSTTVKKNRPSLSREGKRAPSKEAPKKKSRPSQSLQPKQKTISPKKPIKTLMNFSDFQTFQPKHTFLEGYSPLQKIIDQAGCTTWQARKDKDKKICILKETSSPHEIIFFQIFQHPGGKSRRQFIRKTFINHLPRLIHHTWIGEKGKTQDNIWLEFDCPDQKPLQKLLYKLQYQPNSLLEVSFMTIQVEYRPLHRTLCNSPSAVKKMLLDVCRVLQALSDRGIVHGRINPQSIFIKLHKDKQGKITLLNCQLHNFDGWFEFSSFQKALPRMSMELSPPEILNFLLFQRGEAYDRRMLDYLQDYSFSWVIDMWSLGIVVLELLLGYPLSLRPQRVSIIGFGEIQPLFDPQSHLSKILQMQLEIVFNLDSVLNKNAEPAISRDLQLQYLLKRMLSIDPKKRISPAQIIHILK